MASGITRKFIAEAIVVSAAKKTAPKEPFQHHAPDGLKDFGGGCDFCRVVDHFLNAFAQRVERKPLIVVLAALRYFLNRLSGSFEWLAPASLRRVFVHAAFHHLGDDVHRLARFARLGGENLALVFDRLGWNLVLRRKTAGRCD